MKEAMQVHHDFLNASLKPKEFEEYENDDPNEEDEDEVLIRLGYKYNFFKLKEGLIICIRCQVHSYTAKSDGSKEYSNLFVLPEWNEKRQNWTKDLDQSIMGMLTKEITDNSNKFSRWTIQSIIDGVDKMRFTFV